MHKCPVFRVADLVGKKWAIVVIQEVALNGENGFNAIRKRMASISPKLLSQRLKNLETNGILKKRIITEKTPFKTEYKLTDKGRELNDIITLMRKWQVRHNPEIKGCESRECVRCPLY